MSLPRLAGALSAFAFSLTIAPLGAEMLDMPVPDLTPGAFVTSDPAVFCKSGYSRTVRPVGDEWERLRSAVLDRYNAYNAAHNMYPYPRSGYAYDHLVPLEIGGSPRDVRNLWPQPISQALEKDRVEDALHILVCGRRMSAIDAQIAIAHNWMTAVPANAQFTARELEWLNRPRSYGGGDD